MTPDRKSLLDEIKRMYPDIPEDLKEILSKLYDEAALTQVKETMRKEGDKYHFFIENDEFIVSGGKSGKQFSLMARLENGEEVIVSQSGSRSSYVVDDMVVQSNGGKVRFVALGSDGATFEADDKGGVWQTSDGTRMSADRHGNTSLSAEGIAANIKKNEGNLVDWGNRDGTHSFSWKFGKGEDIILEEFELQTDSEERGSVQVGFRNGTLCSIKQEVGEGKETYNLQYQEDKVVYEATVSEEAGKDRELLEVFEDGLEYSCETHLSNKSVSTKRLSLEGGVFSGKDGELSFAEEEKKDGRTVYKKTVSCEKIEDAFYSKMEEHINGTKIKATYIETDDKRVLVEEVVGDYSETKMKVKRKWFDDKLVSEQCWEDGKCVYEYDKDKGQKNKKSDEMKAWLRGIPKVDGYGESDICQLVGSLNTEIHDFEMMGYKRKGNNLEAYRLDISASELELTGDLSSIATNFCGNLAVGGIPFEVDGKEQNNQDDENEMVVLHTDDGHLYYKGSIEGFPEFLAKFDGETEMSSDKVYVEDMKGISSAVLMFKNRFGGR